MFYQIFQGSTLIYDYGFGLSQLEGLAMEFDSRTMIVPKDFLTLSIEHMPLIAEGLAY